MPNDQFHQFFSADQPITERDRDELGRASFADAIGRAIVGWTHHDSLVIALYGPWGIGKSSIKNMVVEALKPAHKSSQAIIAEFNPWQFANRDQLLGAFFDQVGVAIGRGDVASKKKRDTLLKKWQRYGAYLTATSSAFNLLRTLGVAAVIVGAVVIGVGRAWPVAEIVGAVLGGLGSVFALSSRVAGAVAEYLRIGVEVGKQTIDEVKSDLGRDLRALEQPLVVMIDDVDRLTPAETIELLQIIKANVDLPNVIFFILCDRAVVTKHIQEMLKVDGDDFLEKIVQIGFDVPSIERTRMLKVLTNGLDQILSADPSIEQTFDQNRWANLFIGGIDRYFKNLRDVNRFLGTLAFHVSLFRGDLAFQVNVVDLIALETLRVFEPNFYAALPAMKSHLTNAPRFESRSQEQKDAVLALQSLMDPKSQAAATQIIKELFPPAEWAFGGPTYSHDSGELWVRNLRVCADEMFDRYFHLTIPEGDISQDVIVRILGTDDRRALRLMFEAFVAARKIDQILDRLEAYKTTISPDRAVAFITALFDISDQVSDDMVGMFSMAPGMHLTRIVLWCLKSDDDKSHRDDTALEAIAATEGLYGPVRFVQLDEPDEKKADQREPVLSEVARAKAKDILLPRLKAAAASGRLLSTPHGIRLLYAWYHWEGVAEPQKLLTELAQTPAGAIQVLSLFLQKSTRQGAGDRIPRIGWFIQLENLEMFVSPDEVQRQLAGLEPSQLDELGRRAVRAFENVMSDRAKGRTGDRAFFSEDDED